MERSLGDRCGQPPIVSSTSCKFRLHVQSRCRLCHPETVVAEATLQHTSWEKRVRVQCGCFPKTFQLSESLQESVSSAPTAPAFRRQSCLSRAAISRFSLLAWRFASATAGGVLPMGPGRRRLSNRSTHSRVRIRHALRDYPTLASPTALLGTTEVICDFAADSPRSLIVEIGPFQKLDANLPQSWQMGRLEENLHILWYLAFRHGGDRST